MSFLARVAPVFCFGLPGREPTCQGPQHKGLCSGETGNQVMIPFAPVRASQDPCVGCREWGDTT